MCCDPKHLKTTRPDRPCPLPSHNTGCYTQSPHRARPVLPWPVRAMRLRPSYCERGVFSHISSTYCTRPVRSWPVRVLRLCPSYCKRGVSSPLSYISYTACPFLACPCHAMVPFAATGAPRAGAGASEAPRADALSASSRCRTCAAHSRRTRSSPRSRRRRFRSSCCSRTRRGGRRRTWGCAAPARKGGAEQRPRGSGCGGGMSDAVLAAAVS